MMFLELLVSLVVYLFTDLLPALITAIVENFQGLFFTVTGTGETAVADITAVGAAIVLALGVPMLIMLFNMVRSLLKLRRS